MPRKGQAAFIVLCYPDKGSFDGAKAWAPDIEEISADGGREIPANIKHWYIVL